MADNRMLWLLLAMADNFAQVSSPVVAAVALLDDQPEPNRIFGVLTCSSGKSNDRPRFEITETQSYPLDITLDTPPVRERVTVNTSRHQSALGLRNDDRAQEKPSIEGNIIVFQTPCDSS